MHLASKDGHAAVVEALIERGALIDAATRKGNTALHIAALAGQDHVVRLLVQHGAQVGLTSFKCCEFYNNYCVCLGKHPVSKRFHSAVHGSPGKS